MPKEIAVEQIFPSNEMRQRSRDAPTSGTPQKDAKHRNICITAVVDSDQAGMRQAPRQAAFLDFE